MTEETSSSFVTGKVLPLFVRLGTVGLGIVVVAGGILYAKQESLLYYPEIGGIPRRPRDNPRGYRSPEERQIPYEDHMVTCTDGVQIHAWLLKYDTNAPTIIFFHGNAGNIGLRLPNAIQMIQYLHVNVFMVEYRGYGNSDSAPINETGLNLDAEASLHYAHTKLDINKNKIFLFGRSLGGSVAAHLTEYAERKSIPLAGLIMENTFTSISDMVDQLMPFLKYIKPFVLRMSWDSYNIMLNIKLTPILFLAGARDELVPHHHMDNLYQRAKQQSSNNRPVHMHIIPDGTHNESWLQGGPAYWDAIRNFINIALSNDTTDAATKTTKTTTITMNGGGHVEDVKSSSIPIMSSRFVDMAKEAAGMHKSTSNNQQESSDPKKEL